MLRLHVYFGDTFRILKAKQKKWKGKFRTVFADPPYYVSVGKGILQRPEGIFKTKGYRLYKGDWDDNLTTWEEVYQFNYEWMKLVKPLIAEDGTLWICGFWNFNLWTVRMAMEKLGYSHLNNITIIKPNAVPNLKGVRFAGATDDMVWTRPNKARYFAYHRMKAYKGTDSRRGKQMKNYWIIPVDTRDSVGRHTTQKPLEQLRRVILSSTDEGDWVLDPFLGSGTTLRMCKELHRNGIGIERGFYFRGTDNKYRCTCGKKFNQKKYLLKHYDRTEHRKEFVRDIQQKIGWGDQTLDGQIKYKMFWKYFKK